VKTLVSVAIFGLLPVPPMADTLRSSSYSRRSTEGFYFSQLALAVAEKMATKEASSDANGAERTLIAPWLSRSGDYSTDRDELAFL